MRKLIVTCLAMLISLSVFAQFEGVGTTTLQRMATSKGYFYRDAFGTKGPANWYTKEQLDSLLALRSLPLIGANGITKIPGTIKDTLILGGALTKPVTLFTGSKKAFGSIITGTTGIVSAFAIDTTGFVAAIQNGLSGGAAIQNGVEAKIDEAHIYTQVATGPIIKVATSKINGIVLQNSYNNKAATYNSVTDFTTAHSIPDVEWVGSRGYALDANVIHKTGNETKNGTLTLTGSGTLLSVQGNASFSNAVSILGTFNLNGNTGTGTTFPIGITVANGVILGSNSLTFTDNFTGTGITSPILALNSFGIVPVSAANTGVVYNIASTVKIDGSPILGTNTSFNKSLSLYVKTGNSLFGGDIEVNSNLNGIILKSPDGTRYRITVANGGTLTVTAL